MSSCCKDSHGECLPLNSRDAEGCAYVVLLMMGDGYLPGAFLVGSQLKHFAPHVDRICMVTPDVSDDARKLLLQVFTRLYDTDYIKTKRPYVREELKKSIYPNTFTKLRCLELEGYKKIALLDADTIPLSGDILHIFSYSPPSAPFVACASTFRNPTYAAALSRNVCEEKNHDRLHEIYKDRCFGLLIGYETAVMLVKPSKEALEKLLRLLDRLQKEDSTEFKNLRADTTFLNKAWRDEWRPMDPRFLGRWNINKDVVITDCYGSFGKPWETQKFEFFLQRPIPYTDVLLWWIIFIRSYRREGRPERLKGLYKRVRKALKIAISMPGASRILPLLKVHADKARNRRV